LRAAPPLEVPPPLGHWLARLVWHPAVAYALVAVLLLPVLRNQLPRFTESARPLDARRDAPAPPAMAAPKAAVNAVPARPPEAMYERDGGAGAFAKAGRAEAPAKAAAPAAASAPPAPPPVGPGQPASEPRAETEDAEQRRGAAELADKYRALRARSQDVASARGAPAEQQAPLVAKKERQAEHEATPPERNAGPADQLSEADAEGARPGLAGHVGEPLARAVAPSAAPAGGSDTAVTLEVGPMRATVFAFAEATRATRLRVTPSADLPNGPLDVTVRSRAGGHELHMRVAGRADAIVIQMPPHWLATGDYVITLEPVDTAANAASTLLGFSVRAP
jgi:hypothetical protein